MLKALIVGVLVAMMTTGASASMNHVVSGVASWYALFGQRTASGQIYTPLRRTCAMTRLRLGQTVWLYAPSTRKWSWCLVNDRGPFVSGRVIDVSPLVRKDLRLDGLLFVHVYIKK